VRRDLAAVLPDLPPHGEVVTTGFSQGAAVALDLALAGDAVQAGAVIGVGPSYPPSALRVPEAMRTLSVVILRGADDPWGLGVPGTVDALRAAGHRVHVEDVPGLGHEYPADFTGRLPDLLAKAGVRAS
jgi:predicted esterase